MCRGVEGAVGKRQRCPGLNRNRAVKQYEARSKVVPLEASSITRKSPQNTPAMVEHPQRARPKERLMPSIGVYRMLR